MLSKLSILRDIQGKKQGGLSVENKIGDTIAKIKKQEGKKIKTKYINQNPKSKIKEMISDNKNYILEPFIPVNLERFIIFLSGQSGSGKTLVSSELILQYLEYYKGKRKCYYVCNTKIKDDINLSKIKQLKQLSTENLEQITIEDLKDSLVIVDDTDFHEDHKKILKWMNIIVECGRKFGTSLIYSSHIHSKLSESPIYKEVSMYITFSDSLINNRMLSQNLKIHDSIVNKLLEENNAFICFNKIYRTIFTDNILMKY